MRNPNLQRDYSFQFRSESWTIPRTWYLNEYLPGLREVLLSRSASLRSGLCNSVSDTLDSLWQPFRGEAQGSAADFHALLGCYNLHRSDFEGASYLFWTNGWGAPHKVFLYACQLIATYVRYTDLRGVTNHYVSAQCDGFTEFLREMIFARTASRSERNPAREGIPERCGLTINFRNRQNYARVHAPLCYLESWPGPANEHAPTDECNLGVRPEGYDEGVSWQMGEPFWDSIGNCFSKSATSGTCENPDFGSSYGGIWNIVLHPSELYWRGVACDTLLFHARMCNDYSLDRLLNYGDVAGALQYRRVAQHLSRYTLHYILHIAYAIIHEAGHTFRSDSYHCSSPNGDTPACCFDIAGKAFKCRVRAHLGIPEDQINTAASGNDFVNPTHNTTSTSRHCSADNQVYQYLDYRCDTIVEGQPNQEAIVRITNLTCAVPADDFTFTTQDRQACRVLCSQVSQSPADLAECLDNCEDRYPDPDGAEERV